MFTMLRLRFICWLMCQLMNEESSEPRFRFTFWLVRQLTNQEDSGSIIIEIDRKLDQLKKLKQLTKEI